MNENLRHAEWWASAKQIGHTAVGGWVEVVDENGTTVYVHLETGQVLQTRPKEWVQEMMKYYMISAVVRSEK